MKQRLDLYPKLIQMMIKVFVHENGPLLRVEWTEERVWVLGAACDSLSGEAVDGCEELRAFALKLAL